MGRRDRELGPRHARGCPADRGIDKWKPDEQRERVARTILGTVDGGISAIVEGGAA